MSPPGRDAAPAGTGAADNTANRTCSAGTADGQGSRGLPPSARPSDPGTSWAGTLDPEGRRPRIIDEVVVEIAHAGARGRTVAELLARRGGDRANLARRVTDCAHRDWVRADGTRKSQVTGYHNTVWVATASGQKHAAAVLAAMAHEGAA